MDQTPAHDNYNPDLLRLMDRAFEAVIEVGCSRGALAKAYRASFPQARYLGVEIDAGYAEAARQHCDRVLSAAVESPSAADWSGRWPTVPPVSPPLPPPGSSCAATPCSRTRLCR